LKEVQEVVKGDIIKTPNSFSEVSCVVKTYCSDGKTALVKLDDGLKITPWHPIRVEGQWRYPCELEEPVESECEAVYSFVLKANQEDIMIVNGVECATLGHRYMGEVIGHPYFGSNKVTEDLRTMRGWIIGHVELSDHNCLVKDELTGLVCGLQQ
uniref:hypothetical protein n=1 Tax=Salmonella sp. s51228 TaxID=3159652 RepID=UPI003980FEF5